MLKNKYIDRICIIITCISILFTIIFINGNFFGISSLSKNMAYVDKLFDKTKVNNIEIYCDDIKKISSIDSKEEYVKATIIINNEVFKNVGIRIKGNNSLRLTQKYGLTRYSLKIEFDHYEPKTYYGLDKFSLDSSFQDNSYMKTYLAFNMMEHMKVPTPLYSYSWLKINGEDKGLFLAIEEIENSFAKRNFGKNHGKIYKPDYKSLLDENLDVALIYNGDDFSSYENIFRKAKFFTSDSDKKRLIKSLKILSSGKNLESAIDIDEVLRYFVVQVFVVNIDSYLGKTGHNYFLYEKDGILSILPWDYNLAFATYSLAMPNPINDSNLYINYPIDTPSSFEVMSKRPLYHNVMKNEDYFKQYHIYFDIFIKEYFESGYFEDLVKSTSNMIEPYVKKDKTAFCSFEEHKIAVNTIKNFCILRSKSIRMQLDGKIPSTIKGQRENKENFVDSSSVWIPDMGEIDDLKD